MTHFPVSNSNLSAVHLGQYLRRHYTIGESVTCRLIKAGINDTYLVDNGDHKFVFRVYSLGWRTRREIEEEIRLLLLLKTGNHPISYPVPDRDDAFIQTLNAPEGDRYAVMFSYAEGQKLQTFSPDVHHSIGQLMARIHQTTRNLALDRVVYTPEILLSDSLEKISAFLPADTDEMRFMKSARTLLLNQLESIGKKDMRKGIVHLDIWFDNLNIASDGKVTLFDFDFCGNGWLGLDLGYYMMQVYHLERDEVACETKLTRFFEGYESVLDIPDDEKKALPALGICLYFFYLGVQCQRYDNWSNVFLNEAYLKRYITLIVKRYFDMHHLDRP